MAARGRAILIGDGSAHTNPIDERDLSAICADAVLITDRDLPPGGPEVLSRRRIAEMAFEALNRKPRISSIAACIRDNDAAAFVDQQTASRTVHVRRVGQYDRMCRSPAGASRLALLRGASCPALSPARLPLRCPPQPDPLKNSDLGRFANSFHPAHESGGENAEEMERRFPDCADELINLMSFFICEICETAVLVSTNSDRRGGRSNCSEAADYADGADGTDQLMGFSSAKPAKICGSLPQRPRSLSGQFFECSPRRLSATPAADSRYPSRILRSRSNAQLTARK